MKHSTCVPGWKPVDLGSVIGQDRPLRMPPGTFQPKARPTIERYFARLNAIPVGPLLAEVDELQEETPLTEVAPSAPSPSGVVAALSRAEKTRRLPS